MRESRLFRIGKGGGISILNDYTLDKSLFSEQEQEQMLTALQGMIATTEKNSLLHTGLFRAFSIQISYQQEHMGILPPPCSNSVLMNRKYRKLLPFLEKRIYNKATTNRCFVEECNES